MKKISTVTGEIELDRLGNTLTHEHVLVCSTNMRYAFGERWFERAKVVERAVRLFREIKLLGVDTVIDGTPLDLGRDVGIMREVSERSGVNILVSSGMYITDEHFMSRWKHEKLAEYFIHECKHGIGETDVKPAILKCAIGNDGITPACRLKLEAMSIVQRETGLPIYSHNTHSIKSAYGQLELFERMGVDLGKVIIGHCSDTSDTEYLTDIAKSGCFLGFDRIYASSFPKQAVTIAELISRGYADKILLSHDYCGYSDSNGLSFEEFDAGGGSFTVVHKRLIPELRRLGADNETIFKLTNLNPMALFE